MELNDRAVTSYLLLRMFPSKTGIFGERRAYGAPQYRLERTAYDEKFFLEKLKSSVEQAVEGLDEVWVPLSGGVDSSSIVWALSEVRPDLRVNTVNVSFPRTDDLDEAEDAKMVSEAFETEHTSHIVRDLLYNLDELVQKLSEPKWTLYPYHLYSKCDGVIISGMGGDEIFGGYSWKYQIAKRYSPLSVRERVTMWLAANNYGVVREALGTRSIPYEGVTNYFEPFFSVNGNFLDEFRICDLEAKAIWDFCFTEELMCREFGFDIRYPYMRKDILEYGMGLPTEQLFKDNLGKVIIRRALKGKLPQEILDKPKVGFGPNLLNLWDEELWKLCEMYIPGGSAVELGYVNEQYVRKILAKGDATVEHLHDYKIMGAILSLEYLLLGLRGES